MRSAVAHPSDTEFDLQAKRTYARVRVVLYVLVVALAILGTYIKNDMRMPIVLVAAGVFTVVTVAYFALRRREDVELTQLLTWLAPLDLVGLGALTIALHAYEDPVYPALISIPVFYSYVVRRRDGMIIAAAAAFTYLIAHNIAEMPNDLPALGFILVKTAAIGFVAAIATAMAGRYRERESEIEASREEKDVLNTQLRRRLAELQAVSQMNEIIHSSLDFDRVGPLVLDIVTKVIDVPSCCLFVIDRQKSRTLFSASVGMSGDGAVVPPRFRELAGGMPVTDDHYTCLSILDHHQMMVVFCAESGAVDDLTEEDRLVLQAVASELVVAVENSQLYKLTKRLAITDELTGLNNYRYLQQRLDEEIERARRYSKDVSFVMLDVDEFKRFNDTQGHIAGDLALAELGTVLRNSVREVDVVARYGGEEFSVILPETDGAGVFVVAEKIREAIASHLFADSDGDRSCHITVSLGLATYPHHARDKESLLRLADDALYHAKNSGKNRVRSPRIGPGTAVGGARVGAPNEGEAAT
ncbi:MAG: GGDEF domain-containing protein [Actinomycetota bacterium]|nr:GGDEF domain-containing protein [Actinomycetota bacterium]